MISGFCLLIFDHYSTVVQIKKKPHHGAFVDDKTSKILTPANIESAIPI
jgi:hypothetical protein